MKRDQTQYDESRLRRELEPLPLSRRVLFACACAETLLPVYGCYCGRSKKEGYELARAALDAAWAMAQTNLQSSVELDDFSAGIEALADLTDESGDLMAAVAENATACLAYVMETIRGTDASAPVWAARQVYEAADAIVQATAPVHEYVDPTEQEPPVLLVVLSINSALNAVATGSLDTLQTDAGKDGEKLLSFICGI